MSRRMMLVALAGCVAVATVPAIGADDGRTRSQAVLPLEQVDWIQLDPLDVAALQAEDVQRADAGLPPRFAVPEPTFITPQTDGTWEPDGQATRIWRFRISSPGAVSLNLGFNRYYMPAAGQLLIYATDGSYALRPFTDADNEEHGELWTPVVLSDDIIVEVQIPTKAVDQLQLELTSINVGYRGFGDPNVLESGSCNVDVVCPEGDNWREEIPAIGVISTGGGTFCSGFMVNNTAQDETPYFMTANHCGINSGNAASLVVYWNYENSTCRPPGSGSSGSPGDGVLTQNQTGSFFRSTDSASDFTLVELDSPPDPSWNISFAGWDRGSQDATSAVAIHHPSTDEKRISFENDPTTTTTYLQNAVPGDGTHVRVTDWDLGTTEGGSSGSPLFDQNHHVVGQLHGGFASCTSQTSDWYGRFSVSWTGGGSSSTRLSNWLDPGSTGAMTVDTLAPWAAGMSVTPANGLSALGNGGGPFAPDNIVYTLENRGSTSINYTVTANEPWVSIANGAGSIPGSGMVNVTVSIGSAADSLPNGLYTDTVTMTNTTDGSGNTTRPISLQIGVPELVYSFNMDTDPSWTAEGLWAYGQPAGGGGQYGGPDPTSGFTGGNVYGYNLAGDYENNLPQRRLTTTAIDCTDLSGVELKFQRWLGVEQPSYDHAYVQVSNNGSNWTTVWENAAEIADASWSLQSYDISAVADHEANVQVRWTMGTTDGSWRYCGWNIDDVEIHGILPSTAVGTITAARSCVTHGGAGEFCLDLDASNIEPRQEGVTKLEFDVSDPASAVSASADCVNTTYGGSISTTADGSTTVTVEFAPALPDEDCCTVSLTGDVGDSYAVRALAGDVSQDGSVTTGDASIIKAFFGQTTDAVNVVYDYNRDGSVTTADFSEVKPLFNHITPDCP